MKTHRELLDNYYEASWALAMEQVAVRQGERAKELQKQLEEDPGAEVPQHTVRRCRMAIRRAFAPSVGRRVRGVLTKVLVAAVLCAAMTTAACAFSPQFREFLSEIFSHVAQTFTAITFRNPKEEDVGEIQENNILFYNGLRFEWMPDGYEYVDGEESARAQKVEFINEQLESIRIRVTGSEDASAYTYDSETGTIIPVDIGEFDGGIIEQEKYTAVFWVDEKANKSVSIYATDLSQDKLLLLASGLRY